MILSRNKAVNGLDIMRDLISTTLENYPYGVFLVADGKIKFINPELERILKQNLKDLVEEDVNRIISPQDIDYFKTTISEYRPHEENIFATKFSIRMLSSDTVEIETTITKSSPLHYQDIRCEVFIINPLSHEKQKFDKIYQTNRSLQALTRVLKSSQQVADEGDFLQEVTDVVVEVAGYRMAWIGKVGLTPDENISPVAWSGYVEDYLDDIKITWDDTKYGMGPTGRAIKTLLPIHSRLIPEDIEFLPWREKAIKLGYYSSFAIPLHYDNHRYGSLNIYSSFPDSFDNVEIDLLTRIAETASQGIKSIQLVREKQELDKRLKSSENKYRTLVETANDPILLIDDNGYILEINLQGQNILGYKQSEILGRHINFILTPETLQKVPLEETLGSMELGTSRVFEREILSKSGKRIPVEVSSMMIHFEGRNVIHSILRDISIRKSTEQKLRISEENLSKRVKQLQTLYSISKLINTAGELSIETVFQAITNELPHAFDEEIFGQIIYDSKIYEDTPDLNSLDPIMETEIMLEKESRGLIRILGKKSSGLGTNLEMRPFLENIADLISNFINRQETKKEMYRKDQIINQTQKLEAVGRLAGGIAHDLNNINTSIMGYSDLLLLDIEETHPFYIPLKSIRKSAERTSKLTKQLLAFSTQQTVEAIVVNPNSLLEDAMYMIESLVDSSVSLEFDICEENCLIRIDPLQLDQIILNLVINAQDAISDDGKIIITTKPLIIGDDGDSRFFNIQAGHYYYLSITDTGSGIDPEVLQKIFDPFFTTKPMGSGLGLAIIYGIVKQNGGKINVETQLNKYTRFELIFPQVVMSEEHIYVQESTITEVTDLGNILVIDDDKDVLNFVVSGLKKREITTIGFDTEQMASEYIKQNYQHIEYLLSDIILPNTNGIELSKKIVKLKEDIKILFMSGYTWDVLKYHKLDDPSLSLISKPFTIDELISRLQSLK